MTSCHASKLAEELCIPASLRRPARAKRRASWRPMRSSIYHLQPPTHSETVCDLHDPDRGSGTMPAAVIHPNALVILAASTAQGLAITDMRACRARRGCPLWRMLLTGTPRRPGLGYALRSTTGASAP